MIPLYGTTVWLGNNSVLGSRLARRRRVGIPVIYVITLNPLSNIHASVTLGVHLLRLSAELGRRTDEVPLAAFRSIAANIRAVVQYTLTPETRGPFLVPDADDYGRTLRSTVFARHHNSEQSWAQITGEHHGFYSPLSFFINDFFHKPERQMHARFLRALFPEHPQLPNDVSGTLRPSSRMTLPATKTTVGVPNIASKDQL